MFFDNKSIDTITNIKHTNVKNKKIYNEINEILTSVDKLEKSLELKLLSLTDHINFINDLYNQSIDQYHKIVVNLINQ